jgi:CRP/FNR family cyclic AMP-dependent transcriptional regulator
MYSDINYLYLKNHSIMEGIAKEALYDILNQTVFFRKKKAEKIPLSLNSVSKVYFLIKGKIKVTETDSKGREIIKYISKENDIIGGHPSTQEVCNESAQVISTEAIYFTINQNIIDALSLSIPKLALNLSMVYGKMLLNAQEKYKMLAFMDVKERVVHFFKNWAEEEGVKHGSKTVIKNYLTHNDIASIVCTCRQTVTSILNELKNNGVISYSRKEVVIEDISRINQAA